MPGLPPLRTGEDTPSLVYDEVHQIGSESFGLFPVNGGARALIHVEPRTGDGPELCVLVTWRHEFVLFTPDQQCRRRELVQLAR
jgi:hypothetical protein